MFLAKSLFIFLFLATISSVSSIACGSNPLLRIFGINAAFNEAKVAEGIKYCKSLQGKPNCCAVATINGFQEKADSLLQRLSAAVAKRDQSLIDIRKNALPALDGQLRAMKLASTRALKKLAESLGGLDGSSSGNSGSSGNNDFGNAMMNAMLVSLVQTYGEMAGMLTDSLGAMKSNFTHYQAARTACIIEIVKVQAAAWCLACEPSYDPKVVTTAGITFSSNLKQKLSDSCINYFYGAATQSMIFSINMIRSSLATMTAAMNKIARNNPNGATEFFAALSAGSTVSGPVDESRIPISFPDNCKHNECDWIASTLFKGAKLDETSLTRGGFVEISSSGSGSGSSSGGNGGTNSGSGNGRRLKEEAPKRMLAQDGWDPESDEAGVQVTFENNPGNVNNGGGLYKSMVGGLLVLLTVLLL